MLIFTIFHICRCIIHFHIKRDRNCHLQILWSSATFQIGYTTLERSQWNKFERPKGPIQPTSRPAFTFITCNGHTFHFHFHKIQTNKMYFSLSLSNNANKLGKDKCPTQIVYNQNNHNVFFVKLGGLGRYIVRHYKAISYKIKYFIFGQVPQSSEESSVLCAV